MSVPWEQVVLWIQVNVDNNPNAPCCKAKTFVLLFGVLLTTSQKERPVMG